jgi:xanthine dehydrogenase accessory factor
VRRREVLDRRVCLLSGETSLHPSPSMPGFRYEPGIALIRTFGPAWQILMVGAGPIARYLAPIPHSLGYRVIVCDPRENAQAAWHLREFGLDPSEKLNPRT